MDHMKRPGIRFRGSLTSAEASPGGALEGGYLVMLLDFIVLPRALNQRRRSSALGDDSAAQMLDFFRLSKDDRYYRRLVQGFQRVFSATIFFGTDDQPSGNCIAD